MEAKIFTRTCIEMCDMHKFIFKLHLDHKLTVEEFNEFCHIWDIVYKNID